MVLKRHKNVLVEWPRTRCRSESMLLQIEAWLSWMNRTYSNPGWLGTLWTDRLVRKLWVFVNNVLDMLVKMKTDLAIWEHTYLLRNDPCVRSQSLSEIKVLRILVHEFISQRFIGWNVYHIIDKQPMDEGVVNIFHKDRLFTVDCRVPIYLHPLASILNYVHATFGPLV